MDENFKIWKERDQLVRGWLITVCSNSLTQAGEHWSDEDAAFIEAHLHRIIGHEVEMLDDAYFLLAQLCFKFLSISPWPKKILRKFWQLYEGYRDRSVYSTPFIEYVLPTIINLEKDLASIQNNFPREVYDL